MPTMVNDRGDHPKRRPAMYLDLVAQAQGKLAKGDNPKWKCDSCGNKGAMDYAGQGRVCKSCSEKLGF